MALVGSNSRSPAGSCRAESSARPDASASRGAGQSFLTLRRRTSGPLELAHGRSAAIHVERRDTSHGSRDLPLSGDLSIPTKYDATTHRTREILNLAYVLDAIRYSDRAITQFSRWQCSGTHLHSKCSETRGKAPLPAAK